MELIDNTQLWTGLSSMRGVEVDEVCEVDEGCRGLWRDHGARGHERVLIIRIV